MSNLVKLEFSQLEISGENYMPWTLDIETHLESMSLLETLQEINSSSRIEKAKSLIFLRRHLDESLKNEYLTVKDPSELWQNLKDRFDHQRDIMLPKYRDEWAALRFQDFKKVSEYNSAMFKIVTCLKFCGDSKTDSEMMEKTLSTFHATNVTLQQQYRVRGFKKYSELIACLLLAEKNNELLIKNHESRPTGSRIFSEVYFANSNKPEHKNYFQGRDSGRGRGRGRGRGQGRSGYFNNTSFRYNNQQNRYRDEKKNETFNKQGKVPSSSKGSEATCFRCGTKGHWYKVCRVPEHLCKLYQESVKGKEREVNLVDQSLTNEPNSFGASDFTKTVDDFSVGKINFNDQDNVNEYSRFEAVDFNDDFTNTAYDFAEQMTSEEKN